MHIRAVVLSVPQRVAIPTLIAFLDECLLGVKGGHHDRRLVAGRQDDLGGVDLGVDGRVPGMEARVDADFLFVGGELGVRWRMEEQLDAGAVGGPDHGLDVEDGLAVTCHADELDGVSETLLSGNDV